jgi:hypothetical protein
MRKSSQSFMSLQSSKSQQSFVKKSKLPKIPDRPHAVSQSTVNLTDSNSQKTPKPISKEEMLAEKPKGSLRIRSTSRQLEPNISKPFSDDKPLKKLEPENYKGKLFTYQRSHKILPKMLESKT